MKRLCLGLSLALIVSCATPSPQDGRQSAAAGVWLKGDLHVHDDHSSDGSAPRQRAKDRAKGNVSVADQIGQAEKMGLGFLPLTDHRTFDQYYDPLWESSRLILIPGEEANGSPHAIVLGAADSIVQGAARADRAAFTHVQQSIWDAHSQGASWTVAHPDDGETEKDGVPNAMGSVQGMDLVEIWNRASDAEKEIDYCENRWNAGFRFGIAGASDTHFREFWDRQGPGFPTSNVYAAAANERGVIDGLRAGHTSLSLNPAGPFVMLAAEFAGKGSAMSGDELTVPKGAVGRLVIHVQRAAGMQVLLYRRPGRSAGPLKTFTPAGDDETFAVDIAAGDQPDWYRVEVRGPEAATAPATGLALKALASPVFFAPSAVTAVPEIAMPADAGSDDGALLAIGDAGAFSGFPDVASASDALHMVAELHGPAASSIVYRRQNADRAMSDVTTVSGQGVARFPRIAARGKDVWVIWQEDAVQVPHRPVIRLRHSADGGATWQAAETVRTLDGRAEHPDIAVGERGGPVVVWQEISAGQPFDVMALEIGTDAAPHNLSRDGKMISPGDADDTRSARYPASVWPAVAVAKDGRVAVTWQDNRSDVDPLWTGSAASAGTNPDNWQIAVAIRPSGNGSWPAPAFVGAADSADRHPDAAFGADGELVVAWESKALSPAGKNLSVLAAMSTDGVSFGPSTTLAPDPLAMSERPRLGVDADGAVRAVWYDSRSADWRWRVMTSVWRADAGWNGGRLINGRGIGTWPATTGGAIVFASTRNATRMQRDQTQQIFVLP